jgi:hypothetical protein
MIALQARITLSGEACLPTLQIQDVFSASMARSCAWACFNAPDLNKQLSAHVSANELWLLDQEENHGMDLKDVIANLKPTPVHFGTICPSQVSIVRVWFTNTGRMPARWQLGGSDLPDLELGNWVEPSLPRNNQEALADFILENRIFQYHPHSGALAPGEGCEVSSRLLLTLNGL